MPIGMHAPDERWPAGLLDIYLTFAQIIFIDEEGGFGTILRKNIKEMRRTVVWAVIRGQSQCTTLLTMCSSLCFVSDITD
jgi:hypothetical protein